MTQPRLFPDMAAAPTPRERRSARLAASAAQGSLFDLSTPTAPSCAVCSGEHDTDQCPHGSAPSLIEPDPSPRPPVCDRRYTEHEKARRQVTMCFSCGHDRIEHETRPMATDTGDYDPEFCADMSGTGAREMRYIVNFGETICPDCGGDLTAEPHYQPMHWHTGKPVPWTPPDLIEQINLTRVGPSPCDR